MRRNLIFNVFSGTGVGAFGKVWQGLLHERTDKSDRNGNKPLSVAIKSIKGAVDKDEIASFLSEADSLKSVNAKGGHANVLKLVGVALQGLPPLILIEFAEHGNLKGYLIKQRQEPVMSASRMVRFGQDIAAGMSFLASLHVVHRGELDDWYLFGLP